MQHRLNIGESETHKEAFFEPENMLSSSTLFAHDQTSIQRIHAEALLD